VLLTHDGFQTRNVRLVLHFRDAVAMDALGTRPLHVQHVLLLL